MTSVQPYEELQDIAIRVNGTADALVQLIKSNGLALDAVLNPGMTLQPADYTPVASDPELLKPYILPEPPLQVFVQSQQNLTDMVLQEYGAADALVAACKLNGLALDAELQAEMLLNIGKAVRNSVREYYLTTGKKVCTGGNPDGANIRALLQEDGSFILQEDGSNILLED